MTLENQVTSLELSKRLKELGFKQDSLFYYERGLNKNNLLENYYLRYGKTNGISDNAYISAYTVAELGEMFPDGIMTIKTAMPEGFICIHANTVEQHREYDLTEANSRAKMLIYLKENNLI